MGLIQAVSGSIGGMIADQWKDFYTVPSGLPSTAAVLPAVTHGTYAGRGSNTRGSAESITSDSMVAVPGGCGLRLCETASITSSADEAGGYEWKSDDVQSPAIFAGNGIESKLIK